MVTSFARTCLVLCLFAPSIAAAQPAKTSVAPKETEGDKLPALPTAGADATPLRKAQVELVREGADYVARCKELIRTGTWVMSDFRRYADVLTETCRVAGELEEKPANRLAWLELRVRRMKEIEALVDRSVQTGSAAPQELNFIRFQRLQAEVDLLKLKAEVEKGRK